jgi:hypothetical protein
LVCSMSPSPPPSPSLTLVRQPLPVLEHVPPEHEAQPVGGRARAPRGRRGLQVGDGRAVAHVDGEGGGGRGHVFEVQLHSRGRGGTREGVGSWVFYGTKTRPNRRVKRGCPPLPPSLPVVFCPGWLAFWFAPLLHPQVSRCAHHRLSARPQIWGENGGPGGGAPHRRPRTRHGARPAVAKKSAPRPPRPPAAPQPPPHIGARACVCTAQ